MACPHGMSSEKWCTSCSNLPDTKAQAVARKKYMVELDHTTGKRKIRVRGKKVGSVTQVGKQHDYPVDNEAIVAHGPNQHHVVSLTRWGVKHSPIPTVLSKFKGHCACRRGIPADPWSALEDGAVLGSSQCTIAIEVDQLIFKLVGPDAQISRDGQMLYWVPPKVYEKWVCEPCFRYLGGTIVDKREGA